VSFRQLVHSTVGFIPCLVLFALAAPATAQEASPEEIAAYYAWHGPSQANDMPKAIEAAQAYLKQYPSGQYADYLGKWLTQTSTSMLDAAIKEKNTAEVLRFGRVALAANPENLAVLYALSAHLRGALLASPPSYDHAADAAAFSQKAITLIESGKTLEGVQGFDKDSTLAWLYQVLAITEARTGDGGKAISLYEKSTALAPSDVAVAGRNLLALLTIKQPRYADAAKAYNALPEADRAAAEPGPEVRAALDKVNAEADGLIDVAARFVALANVKGLPPATRDKVFSVLDSVYKTRHPDDATGLAALVTEKEKALGGSGD
jgi:hypothetical protein